MDETPGAISDGAPQPLDTERDFEFKPAAQSPSFKCPTCSREFATSQALQTHVIRAHKKFWSTNKRASTPRKQKHKRFNLDLSCPICRREFGNKPALGAHIRHVHGRSATEFPGFRKFGPGMLAQRATAKPQRAKMGRPPQRLSKECPVCHMKYKTRSIMGAHLRKFHGKSLSDFPPQPQQHLIADSPNGALQRGPKKAKHKRGAETCPICKREFSKAYIYAHLRNQHGTTVMKARRAAANTPATPAPVAAVEKQPAQTAEHARHVTFCPICGTNIANVQTAVNFGG